MLFLQLVNYALQSFNEIRLLLLLFGALVLNLKSFVFLLNLIEERDVLFNRRPQLLNV